MNEILQKISQIELNKIYGDINRDFKAGMIGTDYYVTKYTSKDIELTFVFNRKLQRWQLTNEIELVEDEKD